MRGEHSNTLNWLAHEVVKGLLPSDFVVETPDSPKIENVMHHVIKSCDLADLIVANTNGNNPNVLYELAVLDAMGRACIPVKIVEAETATNGEAEFSQREAMPFDRAAYRYFTIYKSPERRSETDRILGEAISAALRIREEGDIFQNPLTDFFGVPLSSFSSAYGLARGYFQNLVQPAVRALLSAVDIAKQKRRRKGPLLPIKGSSFEVSDYPDAALNVIIPDHLHQASRANVEKILAGGNVFVMFKIKAPGREVALYEWLEQHPPRFQWLDIPTTVASLHGTVLGRRGRDANPDPSHPEYREIERDEIGQFKRALCGIINREADHELREFVKVVDWSQTPLPQ
jgi:hypothetical protein